MEALHVHVQSITVEQDVTRAIVIAVSADRLGNSPRAAIRLELMIETLAGETSTMRIERVRDEALRYLDVS